MNNWYKEFERSQREEKRNQELSRQNALLSQQAFQQKRAAEENNRLMADQVRATEKQTELLQQQMFAEERRREEEARQRKEQKLKDRIFELKKLIARSQSVEEKASLQDLLSEAEQDYNNYLIMEEERKRQEALQAELYRQQQEKLEQERQKKLRRQKVKTIIILLISLVLLIIFAYIFIPPLVDNFSNSNSSGKVIGPSLKTSSSIGDSNSSTESANPTTEATPVNYEVEVTIDNLTLRDTPSKNGKNLGNIPKGRYRIVETFESDGHTWGHLASGQGWIALDYTQRVAEDKVDNDARQSHDQKSGTQSNSSKIASDSEPALGNVTPNTSGSVSSDIYNQWLGTYSNPVETVHFIISENGNGRFVSSSNSVQERVVITQLKDKYKVPALYDDEFVDTNATIMVSFESEDGKSDRKFYGVELENGKKQLIDVSRMHEESFVFIQR